MHCHRQNIGNGPDLRRVAGMNRIVERLVASFVCGNALRAKSLPHKHILTRHENVFHKRMCLLGRFSAHDVFPITRERVCVRVRRCAGMDSKGLERGDWRQHAKGSRRLPCSQLSARAVSTSSLLSCPCLCLACPSLSCPPASFRVLECSNEI